MFTLDGVSVPSAIRDVAALLQRLPGMGEKTALRYALALAGADYTSALGDALQAMSFVVRPCSTCGALTDDDCAFCARATGIVCVVHRYQDLLAIERAAPNKMRYFVLGKLLAPLEGIDASDLPLPALRSQVAAAEEMVLALPPSVEGEATALLLCRELPGLAVTRLARGLPHGSNLEFADAITLRGALDERARVAT